MPEEMNLSRFWELTWTKHLKIMAKVSVRPGENQWDASYSDLVGIATGILRIRKLLLE
jgi:hypothetical protein